MMFRNILFLFVAFCGSSSAFSQVDSMESYIRNAKNEDIEIDIPTSSNIMLLSNDNKHLIINEDYKPLYHAPGIGWLYSVMVESKQPGCAMLYPFIMLADASEGSPVGLGNIVIDEIQASHNDSDYDITRDLTIIAEGDMTEYAMADTVAIYPLKLQEPFLGKYNNCVGVYLRKYAHPALVCKILLTDEGIAYKDDAIKELLGSIRYGDKVTPECEEREKSISNRGIFQPFEKKLWRPGILSDN